MKCFVMNSFLCFLIEKNLFKFCFRKINQEIFKKNILIMSNEKKVVLVTGGTGLVGSAIRYVVENEGKNENESFIFMSSKDCDLRY